MIDSTCPLHHDQLAKNHTPMPRFAYVFVLLAFVVLLSPAYALSPGRPSPETANGFNVTNVQFNDGQGIGSFSQIGARQWREQGPSGQRDFSEINRDEWSVYLTDGRVNIQLDLFQKWIYGSDDRSPRQKLYPIVGSSAQPMAAPAQRPTQAPAHTASIDPRINGRNVSMVTAPSGVTYSQLPGGQWSEVSGHGTRLYSERSRDEWSVYLYDGTANVQIDLYKKAVYYSDSNSPKHKLHDIDGVSAGPVTVAPTAAPAAPSGVSVTLTNPYGQALDVYGLAANGDPQYLTGIQAGQSITQQTAPGAVLIFGHAGEEVARYQATAVANQGYEISQQPTTAATPPPPPPPTAPQQYVAPTHQARPQPRQRTTEPRIQRVNNTTLRQIAGIRPASDAEGFPQTEFKMLQMQTSNHIGNNQSLTIKLQPKVWSWRTNGVTYVRVDTQHSRALLSNMKTQLRDKGFFLKTLSTTFTVPPQLTLEEHFPSNKMGSTAVSNTKGFSVGGNAGPSPYSTGVNASYSESVTTSRAADDYEVAVSESGNRISFTWRLCAIGSADDQTRLCNYNEPWNLGHKTAGQIERLYELPSIANNFDAMHHSLVLSSPNKVTGDVHVGISVNAVMERVWLTPQVQAKDDVGKFFEGLGRGFISAAHPDSYRGELLFKLHSKTAKVDLGFDLVLNLEAINQ